MTDELTRLRRALHESAPEPSDEARKSAIAAARIAFDETAEDRSAEKISVRAQGNARSERPIESKAKLGRFLKGLFEMTTPTINWKYAMAGGASLAVLSLVVFNAPMLQRNNLPLGAGGGQEQAKSDSTIVGEEKIAAAPPAQHPGPRRNENTAPSAVTQDFAVARSRPQVTRPPATMKRTVLARKAPRKMSAMRKMVAPVGGAILRESMPAIGYVEQGRDRFTHFDDNPVKRAAEIPVSTFSIDVDTASYAFARGMLNDGVLPARDAVRTEEFINYFHYDYLAPADRAAPFKPTVTVLPSPWRDGARLIHIGIKGYDVKPNKRPPANLVFLVDTSGSMNAPDKLPLLIRSLRMMLSELREDDTVAIVTYAGSAGAALAPTPVKEKAKIIATLEGLTSGGSTAGGEGIRQAYQLAEQVYRKGGVNRVILATDGDFNVGITDREQLKDFVARKRKSGVTLTVLGFGRGNYHDALMQTLAQNGNGAAHYIDTLNEARKALVEELSGNLVTIASDVKIQVEFNPAMVGEYRLVGYETRALKREDFNNDKVDAGDIGAGHTVTAIYEFTPKGAKGLVDDLRYGAKKAETETGKTGEYAHLKIRYKLPGETKSRLITRPVTPRDERQALSSASDDVRFSIATASFAQIMRGGKYTGAMELDDVLKLAQDARGKDPFGYRAGFLNLVRLAKSATAMEPAAAKPR